MVQPAASKADPCKTLRSTMRHGLGWPQRRCGCREITRPGRQSAESNTLSTNRFLGGLTVVPLPHKFNVPAFQPTNQGRHRVVLGCKQSNESLSESSTGVLLHETAS